MNNVNYSLLSTAREARGLTQLELVSKIAGLSQGNYSRMEKGLLDIPDETLKKIATELNFPISFFYYYVPPTAKIEYLYRKRVTMPRKEQIKLEAKFSLLKIWVEALLKDVDIPEFDLPAIEAEGNNSPQNIARKIRYLLNLPMGPIDKLVRSLEKHGILIYFMKSVPEKFDGTTIITENNLFIIVVNDNTPNDRKRRTIAHELGHCIMHLMFPPILDPKRDPEIEVEIFASEFLMPEIDIRRDLTNFKYSQLGDLKNYWKVSKSSLIRRAYDLKFIDKNKYTNMMIELSRSGERKMERSFIDIDEPSLLNKIIDTYINQLGYSKDELSKIISISSEDFDVFLLGKYPTKGIFKIVLDD